MVWFLKQTGAFLALLGTLALVPWLLGFPEMVLLASPLYGAAVPMIIPGAVVAAFFYTPYVEESGPSNAVNT